MSNTRKTYPVIIIGAGPAGLVASHHLGQNNVEHLLLDGAQFPRDKACADIITSKAIRALNRISPSLVADLKRDKQLLAITGTRVYADKHELHVPYKALDDLQDGVSCYSINRKALDYALWSRLQDYECIQQIDDCFVDGLTKTESGYTISSQKLGSITTPLLIVATGSQSTIAQALRTKEEDKHIAIGLRAYFKNLNLPSATDCELFLKKELMPGGFYIAPMANGLFNVNIVVRKDKVKRDKLNLQTVMDNLISSDPAIAERFINAQQVSAVKGSALVLGTKNRSISGDNYMLAGDAAGLIDLISANGIPQAMISGELAAQQALQCIAQSSYSAQSMSSYEEVLKARIKSDLSLGKFLSPLLTYPWFNDLVHGGIKKMSSGQLMQEVIYADKPLTTLLTSWISSPKS